MKQHIRKFTTWYTALVLLMVLQQGGLPAMLRADDEPSREYQVKAAFLYNFAQFVTWPKDTFADDKAPVVIGVYGNNPFGKALETIVNGKSANGRSIIVKQIPVGQENKLADCQIVYVPSQQDENLVKVIKSHRR